MLTSSSTTAVQSVLNREEFVLFRGDCRAFLNELPPESIDLIVSSPPYFMGKDYDRSDRYEDFEKDHRELAPLLVRVLRNGGSLCWQTGVHVRNGQIVPLDFLAYAAFSEVGPLSLRNRIIWHFEHGAHARKRFSGRHETILWFTKGNDYVFNLDAVRVPQKYPGKRHYKGPHKGQFSGNPLGKNSGDVWAIPNVKAKHREKTMHPCQFPVAIPQRLIRGLTEVGDVVLDPYAGVSSAGVAAILEGRRFVGCEIKAKYATEGLKRYRYLVAGNLAVRRWDQPVDPPDVSQAVAQAPAHFRRPHDATASALSER